MTHRVPALSAAILALVCATVAGAQSTEIEQLHTADEQGFSWLVVTDLP